MRKYGKWAGCPEGIPEDSERCVVEVWDGMIAYQCSRKRGFRAADLFCKQHSKMNPNSMYVPKQEEEK